MSLVVVTPAAASPLGLQTFKDHLHITDNTEDTMLALYLAAAVRWVEAYIKRPLITRTMKQKLATFPVAGTIELPLAPVTALTFVKYYDAAGTLVTFSDTNYWTVLGDEDRPGLVVLKGASMWPTLQEDRPLAVEITFVCGYGAASTDVPAEIRNAILILAAHLYEARIKEVTGTIVSKYEFSVNALLAPRRFYSFA